MNRCGIVLNTKKRHIQEYRNILVKTLKKHNIEVWCEDEPNKDTKHTDIIVILGGDGTTLRAFRNYLNLEIPFIGVNFGTVGFLSSVEPQEFFECLPRLLNKDYHIINRSILQVALFSNNSLTSNYHALNEVVIRSNKARLCHQSVYVDGCLCFDVEGDGIICSTPTGSTAYSLSAGGPAVDSELESIVVTPICSRNDMIKSYVAAPQRNLQIVSKDSASRSLMIDGEEIINLSNADMVNVKLAASKAGFIQFHKDLYLNSLSLLSRKKPGSLVHQRNTYNVLPF